MRRLTGVMLSSMVAACGVFGATDDPPSGPASTPQQNAQPPGIDGTAPEGVYVSSSKGDDTATGSPTNPLKTLRAAFAAAKERSLRVIACAEEYPESLTLLDGVSAYGYYDCSASAWSRGPKRAVLRAPSSPAAQARGITLPTRLEGFEIVAPDLDGAPATDTVGTSIALEVHDSQGLVLAESLLHAGKGAPGTDGADGAENSRTGAIGTASGGQKEVSIAIPCIACKVQGPAGAVTSCAIGPSGGPGGQGGDGLWYVDRLAQAAGEYRGRPFVATADTAVGGINEIANGFGHGLNGTPGNAGADGPDGASGGWQLTAQGFTRGNGSAGSAGSRGQGGGGGGGTGSWWYGAGSGSPPAGSTNAWTATGGSGGGGGCPGQSGTPGTGGGASIGALVFKSGLTLDRTRIETSSGGRAGKGSVGAAGITGGSGGLGAAGMSGDGGSGGAGGNGGASGHGAAGPSIALAFEGTRPVTTSVDLAPGAGGAGQPAVTGVIPTGRIGVWNPTYAAKTLPAVPAGDSKTEHEIIP